MKPLSCLVLLILLGCCSSAFGQLFPDPVTLGTGYNLSSCTSGTTTDPKWQVYSGTTSPPVITPANYLTGFTFLPAKVNCTACSGWGANQGLYRWISPDGVCTNNTVKNYYIYRLKIDLPQNCTGTISYSITFNGYVDDNITNIYINGVSTGISTNVSSQWANPQSITLNSGWVPGANYIDIVVYNSGPGVTGLQFSVTSTQNNNMDSDGDGIADIFDQCPCQAGNNAVGCSTPSFTCDVDLIRSTFTGAGCKELIGCWDDCSMYFLNPQYLSGSAAQTFAQNYGANLISIQSATENACILNDLNRLGYGSGDVIWIGFNDEAVEGQFVWYDQSPVVYTNWATGEPNNSGNNENCVQIYPGGSQPGTWNDLNCGGYNSMSIIEVNLCPVTKVNPPITICQEMDTVVKVNSTLLGSSPYTYLWNSGSTQSSQAVSPMSSTDYYVTTTDRYKCSTKDTATVIVNDKPIASFSDDAGCKSTALVNFTNGSTIADNSTLTSSWNFGNGQTSSSTSPQNTYPTFGSQTATLVVTSTANCKDTISKTLGVFAKPIANFTYNANCSQQPEIVLTNSSSSPDNATLSSTWSYGNGQTSTATSPTITLPNPTGNSVVLVVSTPDNCKDTVVKTVDSKVFPVANFSSTSNCIDEVINLTNTSTIADNTTLTTDWNFGNGQTSTSSDPTISYSTSGNHSVTLVVTSVGGCKDTLVKDVVVYPFPNKPVITSNSPVACPGDVFAFGANSISGASYFWSGPQSFASTTKDNTLTATEDNIGNYSVYVKVNGCPSEAETITLSILGQILPLTEEMPNVVTPNGDGKNDVIDLNNYFTSCTPFVVTIFNRWGNIVWKQESNGAGFEGKDTSGKELADGVYFYKLTYGKELKQGFITIIR